MKTLMISMIALFAATGSAFAAEAEVNVPDMMHTYYTCNRVPLIPDYGFEVDIQGGGFAGIMTAQIKKFFFFGHSSTETFVIKSPISNIMGVQTYVDTESNGQEFKMTISVTRRNDDGTVPATVTTSEGTMQLSCKYNPNPAL